MKYIVRSKIKTGGKIRPVGSIVDLDDVNPELVPSVIEPYLEPAAVPAPPAPEPSVPAELLRLEPLPEPVPAPAPPRPVPKAPVFPKTKSKKR